MPMPVIVRSTFAAICLFGVSTAAQAQSFTEFAVPEVNFASSGASALGPDGNIYFQYVGLNRMSPTGTVTALSPNTATFTACTPSISAATDQTMTLGPDGALWYNTGGFIGRYNPLDTALNPHGSITFFAVANCPPIYAVTTGPDGNIWFTTGADNKIGRMSLTGDVTLFTLPMTGGSSGTSAMYPGPIIAGRDGNLWVGMVSKHAIGRITPSGQFTEFPLTSRAFVLTNGPDGNVWFAGTGTSVAVALRAGKITPAGVVTEYTPPTPSSGFWASYGITEGPDGNVWFTQSRLTLDFAIPGESKLTRITPSGTMTDFIQPASGYYFGNIIAAAGNLNVFNRAGFTLANTNFQRTKPYISRLRPVPLAPTTSTTTTSTTLREGAVYSSAQVQTQSFLRFSNTGSTAGTVSVTLADFNTGQTLVQWTSPSVPAGASPQYGLSIIEAAATAAFTKPTYYSVSVTSQFAGVMQHVLYRPFDGTLTNLSLCDAGVTASRTQVANVHSGLLTNGFPSSIVLFNTGTAATTVTLGVFDSTTGARLGTHTTSAIAANAQAVVTVAAIEAGAGIAPTSIQYHYTIKVESAFTGHIQHLVTNQQAGVVTDMTTVCPLSAS